MPDPSGVPTPPRRVEKGESLLGAISREMVRAMKEYWGKGPVRAKSYLVDDLLFVVLRGGVTTAEQTMLEAGEEDTVRAFRQTFENHMDERLTGLIEQLTGRKVVNFQSQILFDPDMSIEIFVFDRPVDLKAQEETAAALIDRESGLGEAGSDEFGEEAAERRARDDGDGDVSRVEAGPGDGASSE